MKKLWLAAILLFFSVAAIADTATTSTNASLDCQDAQILANVIQNICWSCVLPMRIMGVGPKPKGAAASKGVCMCTDGNGVPEFGWQLGYFQPARIEEVVKTPWCSPLLGGTKLQSGGFEYGIPASPVNRKEVDLSFMDSHFFTFPLFQLLDLLMIPDCAGDAQMDIDLLSMTEIDPMWSNDILAFVLNPESVVFANPLAYAWCAADCGVISSGSETETNYFCAGCDGNLYPFTGNVVGITDPVQVSSLILQRQLASMHRRGLAQKTMGDDEMCGSTYSVFIPRSQYRVSMLYPVPEAKSTKITSVTSGAESTNPADETGDGGTTSSAPSNFIVNDDCCHKLGQTVYAWSTLKGGRSRPGKDNHVYLVWRYVDCCVTY